MHTKQPYAPALTALAGAIGGLAGISPAAVKRHGKDFSRHGGGTGPFASCERVSGMQSDGTDIAIEVPPDVTGVDFRARRLR